jgi:hypothetical protein
MIGLPYTAAVPKEGGIAVPHARTGTLPGGRAALALEERRTTPVSDVAAGKT